MTCGYDITIKGFLPVDPDDMEAMAKALEFIKGCHQSPPDSIPDLHDLVVKTRFVSRRRMQEVGNGSAEGAEPGLDGGDEAAGDQP